MGAGEVVAGQVGAGEVAAGEVSAAHHLMGLLNSTLYPPRGATEWHKLPSSNRWSDFRFVLNQCILFTF